MATELVIFDCDGVLIESERLAVEIDIVMLDDVGWKLSREEIIERFMGRPYAHMLKEIAAHIGHRVPQEWVDRWEALFREKMANELEPVAHVADVIDELHAAGYATCVASGSGPEHLERNLTSTQLFERMAGRIFSSMEVQHGKPAPDIFLHAAKTLRYAPANCVVVEDSRYGVQAARAAGMHCFAYAAGGMTPLAALEGPDTTVFHDMRDLPGLIAAL